MAPNYAEESKDPEADHVAGDLHLGHRARRPLHVHLLDARGLRGARTASPPASPRSSTATSRRSSIRRPTASSRSTSAAHRLLTRAVPADDRHRLVRVSARVLQHGHALPLLDGPRGHPAAPARADAPHAPAARTWRRSSSASSPALIIAGFLLYDSSTLGALLKLGTWAPMMGNIGILAIMGLVSLAIIRYFATEAKGELGRALGDRRPAGRGRRSCSARPTC